jgi:hypothetical protein
MNNAKDFAEIIIAALLCATGGAVVVQALLAIERRRAVPSVEMCAVPSVEMPQMRVSVTVHIVAELFGWTSLQGEFNAALQHYAERFEEQHR